MTSITVAVLGSPNVGKSSLINCLIGTDLSAVCHKPQMTRNAYHCIFTIDHNEIILVDTPGLYKSNQEFHKRLNQQAVDGTQEADIDLILIDLTRDIIKQFSDIRELHKKKFNKSWVVFTKSDKISPLENSLLDKTISVAKKILPEIDGTYFTVSSHTGDSIHKLTGAICDEAKVGPHLYKDEISNKNERFFVSEYIREQIFELLKEEVPYECAVMVEDFEDLRERNFHSEAFAGHISAVILVNRPSQRSILIGSGGQMVKEIGIRSRKKIESMLGGKVYLRLHVKIAQGWFKNNRILEELGLPRAENSNRVWRKR